MHGSTPIYSRPARKSFNTQSSTHYSKQIPHIAIAIATYHSISSHSSHHTHHIDSPIQPLNRPFHPLNRHTHQPQLRQHPLTHLPFQFAALLHRLPKPF
jgi:hypothetical protein